MESSQRTFQVRRQDVAFLRFVIEASDGIAQLTTIDPVGSTVAVVVPPGCEADVDALVRGLRALVPMKPVAGPTPPEEPPAAVSPG